GIYGGGPGAGLAAGWARRRGREVHVLEDAGRPPGPLDAALVFGRARDLVRNALEAIAEGGVVVWVGVAGPPPAGIAVPLLAGERCVRSVTGATRRDVAETLALAAAAPIEPAVETLPMAAVDEGLGRVRSGRTAASVVLVAD